MLVLALGANSLTAQFSTSSILGTVTDEDGAVLPEVTVTLAASGTGTRTAVTDDQGRFRFPALAPGQYVIEAAHGGSSIRIEIYAAESRATRVELRLSAGPPPPAGQAPPPLRWNVWIESGGAAAEPSFEPVERLEVETSYRVVLDLAAVEYLAAGVSGKPAIKGLMALVEEWVETTDETTVEVLMLVDRHFLELQGDDGEPRALSIDVTRIRRLREDSEPSPEVGDPFSPLTREPQADLLFAREVFRLRTTGQTGATSITFSFLTGQRPVGEITVPVRISGRGGATHSLSHEARSSRVRWLSSRTKAAGLTLVSRTTRGHASLIEPLVHVLVGQSTFVPDSVRRLDSLATEVLAEQALDLQELVRGHVGAVELEELKLQSARSRYAHQCRPAIMSGAGPKSAPR